MLDGICRPSFLSFWKLTNGNAVLNEVHDCKYESRNGSISTAAARTGTIMFAVYAAKLILKACAIMTVVVLDDTKIANCVYIQARGVTMLEAILVMYININMPI